jgi:hypothetical protein
MPAPWPDKRFRELTPELLASLSADEVGDAVVQHVHLRVDAEVNNGGFNQFFFNPAGQHAGDALAGYELLGAEDYAVVMRAAIATFEIERERLAPFYEEGTLESFSASYEVTELGEVDQRYYALGDQIYNVWAGVVRARPELFAP